MNWTEEERTLAKNVVVMQLQNDVNAALRLAAAAVVLVTDLLDDIHDQLRNIDVDLEGLQPR